MRLLKITIAFLLLVSLQIAAAQWLHVPPPVEAKNLMMFTAGVPVVAGGALTQVASATNASGEDVYSLATGSRTLAADNNSCLVCVIGYYSYNNTDLTSVKWGSGEAYEKSFVRLGTVVGTERKVEIWYLVDWPSTLTSTITAAVESDIDAAISCTEWTGVNQTTPLENFNSATGDSNAPSVVVSSESGAKVIDIYSSNPCTATVGGDQTEQMNLYANPERSASSIENGATSVTMSWSLDDTRIWSIAGASINPN